MSKHISMGGACINQAVLLAALQSSSLQWRMHPAQAYALLANAVNTGDYSIDIKDLTEPEKTVELATQTVDLTMLGVPIRTREDYPRGWVRLYAGDKLLYHIDSIAIPATFGHPDGWEAGNESDVRKAEILWDNTPTEELPPGSIMRQWRERGVK